MESTQPLLLTSSSYTAKIELVFHKDLCYVSCTSVPLSIPTSHVLHSGPGVTLAHVHVRLHVAREIIAFLSVTDTYIHTYIHRKYFRDAMQN